MKKVFPYFLKPARIAIFLIAVFLSTGVMAQNPVCCLTYPSPVVVIANETAVSLSPNLGGNPSGFSITPALPAGLSFNPSTGIITGIATVPSPATNYTITVQGASNSVTGTLNLQVIDNYFNNQYDALTFGVEGGTTVIRGDNGNPITNTTDNTYGRNVNESVVYKNVITIDNTPIDCIVTTEALTSGTTWNAYDQAATTDNNTFSQNDPKFFSPQVVFPTNGTPGLTLNFQFILGGTYNTTTKTGINVVLKNVKINTYDIDGNGSNNSNQSTEFGGFSSYELANPTNISAPTLNAGLTTFRSSSSANTIDILNPKNRIRVTYNDMSNFRIRLTGQGTSYFFLDFSAGDIFATVKPPVSSPSIDLNTATVGLNNDGFGCGVSFNFIPAGQQNNVLVPSGTLTQFSVSFPTSEIVDLGDEELWVVGSSNPSNFKIPLNAASIGTFTVGGVTYTYNKVVTTGGITTFTFKKTNNDATITKAQAQALLAALRYNNKSLNPTPGARTFTVNVNNSQFKSPDAIYTANINCVSISGNIFHDINGMADNTVNATGTSQFTAGFVNAVLTDASNNVLAVMPISAGGAYNFGQVSPGQYQIYVSTSSPALGSQFTTATYPAGYVPTGENLGSGTGNDLLTDGKLIVTVGSQPITNANFGIQIPPSSSDNTISGILNPGGFNNYTIPNGGFIVNDADGQVGYITINTFPAGAQYIKVGSIYYIPSGGTCPPLGGGCTIWTDGLQVPFTSNNPSSGSSISVSPASSGITSIPINFTAYDNANMPSSPSSILTLNFTDVNAFKTISGNVWNDANGNGTKDGSEALVAPAATGQTLYAVAVQTTNTYSGQPTIYASAIVDANNGYTLPNLPVNDDYIIKIVSLSIAPVSGAAALSITPNLADNWIGVSTNANGTIVAPQSTNDLQIAINSLAADQSNLNFGIEQLPSSTPVSISIQKPVNVGNTYNLDGTTTYPIGPGGTPLIFSSLAGSDPEDGALGTGNSVKIINLPTNADLSYNNGPVAAGQVISNYDASLLKLTITTPGSNIIQFTFAFIDAAGQIDPTEADYIINYRYTLPVELISFTARGNNGDAILDWITSSEANSAGFGVEHSLDGTNWNLLGFVNSKSVNGNSNVKLSYQYTDRSITNGAHYYRLKQTDLNGEYTYSNIAKVDMNSSSAAFKVYPNPSSSYIFIEYSGAIKTPVRIIDMNGRIVKSLYTTGAKTIVETNELPAGTYVISIDGKTNKFTVNR